MAIIPGKNWLRVKDGGRARLPSHGVIDGLDGVKVSASWNEKGSAGGRF